MRLPVLLLACLSVAACDDASPDAAPTAAATTDASSGAAVTPESPATAQWDSTKACDLLPRAAVAEVMGEAVTATDLGRVVAGNSATPAFSQCSYSLASGGSVGFYARQSSGADNDDAAIGEARERSASASPGGVETVDGVGKAAWWAAGLSQLHVFVGDDRYVYLTVPEEPDARGHALALFARVPS